MFVSYIRPTFDHHEVHVDELDGPTSESSTICVLLINPTLDLELQLFHE